MAHAQKPHFVFPRNVRVHSNRWGRQFSRQLAAELCAALVIPDISRSEVAWEHWVPTPFASFPLHFPSRASPFATTFRTSSTYTASYMPLESRRRKTSSSVSAAVVPVAQSCYCWAWYSYACFIACHGKSVFDYALHVSGTKQESVENRRDGFLNKLQMFIEGSQVGHKITWSF